MSKVKAKAIYIANDNLVNISDVTNIADNTYINNAIVTCVLKDAGGNDVAGQAWPVKAIYVAGSNGKYQANIEETVSICPGYKYVLHVDIVAFGSIKYHQEVDCIAQVRK